MATKHNIKRRLLEIFTRPQQLETEIKTGIFNSEDTYHLAILYATMNVSPTTRMIVEDYLRGYVLSSRGLGGKGSEQLISLLYPPRYQEYLFPYPMISKAPEREEEEEKGEEEEKRKRFKWF